MKINKMMMFISIVLISFFVIGAASAAAADDALAVDDADALAGDEDVGTFTDLRKDISVENDPATIKDTVDLNKDYKYNASADSLADEVIDNGVEYANNTNRYESGIYIGNDCTIDGHGNSIDGANVATVFKIGPGATVTLKNIVFKNSKNAIYSSGNLTLDNCTFTDVANPVTDIGVQVVAIIDDAASYDAQIANPNSALNRYYYKAPRMDCIDANGNPVYPQNDKTTLVVGHALNATALAEFPWIVIDVTGLVGNFSIIYDGKAVCNFTLNSAKAYGYVIASVPSDCELTQFQLNTTDGSKPKNATTGEDISMDPSKLQVLFKTAAGNTTYTTDSVIDPVKTKIIADSQLKAVTTVNEFGMIVINATVDKNVTGDIRFIIRNSTKDVVVNMTVEIENGTAVFDELAIFDKGEYTTQTIFAGNEHYKEAEVNGTASVTKTAAVLNATAVVNGNEVTLFFTLPKNATGNVTVTIGNSTVNVTLTNGTANYTFKETQYGGLSVPVAYEGDANYYATVPQYVDYIIKAASEIKSANVNVVYQNDAKFTITLIDSATNAPVVKANVVVVVEGKEYKGVTDANGKAVVTIANVKLVPKTYKATVKFAGDDYLNASSNVYNLVVKKATPKLTAKKKTFKAKVKTKKYTVTLKDNKGKAMKKVKLTLKIKNKKFTAKTNKKGKAVFKIKKLTKKAKYNAKITAKATKYFNAVSKKVKITIK